jgi:hypothetical protein
MEMTKFEYNRSERFRGGRSFRIGFSAPGAKLERKKLGKEAK